MIKHFVDIGKSQSKIAILLGRNKSSISRELRRNSLNGEYLPCDAHYSYLYRRVSCKPKRKSDNPTIFKCVKNLFINHQCSPERISPRLTMEDFTYSISYNTIYRGIYSTLFDNLGLFHENRGAIRVSLGI